MPDNRLDQARVDRRAFAVASFAEAERADRAYWRSRTPEERLEALEPYRRMAYGSIQRFAARHDYLTLLG